MPSLWIFNHYAGYPETVPAVRTYELARELTSRGWDVTVIACSFNHYTFRDDYPGVTNKIWETHREGVTWVFVKGHPYTENGISRLRNMIEYSHLARRWSRTQSRPDVVIGTTVHPFAAEAARKIARSKSVAYCYEITDLWPETLVDLGATTRKSIVYRRMFNLERKSLATSDGVIGLLPLIPEYAAELHRIELAKFCYVPNGVARVTAVKDVPVERNTIAWAGGFAKAHGMPVIVRAAQILNLEQPGRFQFDFYGDGPERAQLEKSAQAAGLTNLHFHGLIPKEQLRSVLARADICLCTGEVMAVHRFGVSTNKLFDYFDAARPVVFAVDSGNDPVAEARAGVSVSAGDAHGIAAAIGHLADMSPDSRDEIGRRGREFLEREHTFNVLGARLDDFLRDLVTELGRRIRQ